MTRAYYFILSDCLCAWYMHFVSLKGKRLVLISCQICIYNRVCKKQTLKQKLPHYQSIKLEIQIFLCTSTSKASFAIFKINVKFLDFSLFSGRAPEGGLQITGTCSQSACWSHLKNWQDCVVKSQAEALKLIFEYKLTIWKLKSG